MICCMTKEEAIKYYGSQSAVAEAIGIVQVSVCKWGEYPPELRQIQLERATKGKLKAEPYCWKNTRKTATA